MNSVDARPMNGADARRWDLLCIGDPCADVVVAVDAPPPEGGKCVGRLLGTFAGGTTSNVACAAARLGARSAVLGPTGDDAHAALLRESFGHFGVDTGLLAEHAGSASSSTIVLLTPSGERSIVYMPMMSRPTDDATLRHALRQARCVYLMPYDGDQLAQVARVARDEDTLVAIDLEQAVAGDRESMHHRIAHADVVFFNEAGFVAGSGAVPSAESLAAILACGPRSVVVTLGGAGAVAMDASGYAEQPAFDCQVVDATGAGDSFNASFLVALLEGAPLPWSLRFACAAASCTVAAIGARAGLPDRRQVAGVLLHRCPPGEPASRPASGLLVR